MDRNFEFAKFQPLIGLLIWLLVSIENPSKIYSTGKSQKTIGWNSQQKQKRDS